MLTDAIAIESKINAHFVAPAEWISQRENERSLLYELQAEQQKLKKMIPTDKKEISSTPNGHKPN